jgi:hypothetical protein
VQLKYLGLENIDAQINGLNSNLMTAPNQIGIAWSNLTPANFPAGKLFDMRFLFKGTTSPVIFNPGILITDINLSQIYPTYVNGEVVSGNPVIDQDPSNLAIHKGNSAAFTIHAQNASSFEWMESTDSGNSWQTLQETERYAGTQTTRLQILNVPLSFTNNIYRCKAKNGGCYANSAFAKLTVDSLTSISEKSKQEVVLKQNYPNPVSGSTIFEYSLARPGLVAIKVFNVYGQCLSTVTEAFHEAGNHTVQYDFSSYSPGVYFYYMILNRDGQTVMLRKKLIVS